MARISGVDLPREKRIEIALTYIFGIGVPSARKILAATGVNPDVRVKDLSEDDAQKLRREIEEHYVVEGDLRREVSMNIKRLMDIGCYRGLRHRLGLPRAEDEDERKDAQGQAPHGGQQEGRHEVAAGPERNF